MAEKYENKFVELYKEAKEITHELSAEDWKKRCDKLTEAFKKIPKDIDEDIEKLTKTKRLFTRRENTKCDMVDYYIEEDCENKPSECPAEIKKIMIEELKFDLNHPWTSPESKEKIKEQIENLEK